MFLYACKQVLVEAQIFTSGNISVANQNVVSKVQQVRYWIPYSYIMRPYSALVCGFALGFASSKTTNSCNIWAHNALLCIQYPIHAAPCTNITTHFVIYAANLAQKSQLWHTVNCTVLHNTLTCWVVLLAPARRWEGTVCP